MREQRWRVVMSGTAVPVPGLRDSDSAIVDLDVMKEVASQSPGSAPAFDRNGLDFVLGVSVTAATSDEATRAGSALIGRVVLPGATATANIEVHRLKHEPDFI